MLTRRRPPRLLAIIVGLLATDGTTSVLTSTTNIGACMWSTLVADRLGVIGHNEAGPRVRAVHVDRR